MPRRTTSRRTPARSVRASSSTRSRPRATRPILRPFALAGPRRSRRTRRERPDSRKGKLRFAVVGLGYFAQAAVLPAFKRAKNADLVALVSDDATKLRQLGREHDVDTLVGYDEYEALLASGEVDAVYITLPNDLHADFAITAARHGVHVLCEKPLAVSSEECRRVIEACRRSRVRLMTAYRLHFNAANLEAARIISSGELGTPRFFTSSFAMQVKPGGIRTRDESRGGGPLYDIGIYCINAARYLFREEPTWVQAAAVTGQGGARFRAIDEQVTAILGFPGGKTATFTASYGATDVACYSVYGTKGCLCLDNAYEFSERMTLEVEVDGKSKTHRFTKRDQVAPEIMHFAQCVLDGRDPEPSGKEGLIDLAIIEAIQQAADTGKRVTLRTPRRRRRPDVRQAHRVRPHKMPELVHATTPFQH